MIVIGKKKKRWNQNIGKDLIANKLWQTSLLIPPEHCPGGNSLKLQKIFGSNRRAITTWLCDSVGDFFTTESEVFPCRLPHVSVQHSNEEGAIILVLQMKKPKHMEV